MRPADVYQKLRFAFDIMRSLIWYIGECGEWQAAKFQLKSVQMIKCIDWINISSREFVFIYRFSFTLDAHENYYASGFEAIQKLTW